MHPVRRIATFTDKYPLLGPLFWLATLQYVAVQPTVAAAWPIPGYDWLNNAISDLGATVCGTYSHRFVCSPLHPLMDASFIVLGLTMLIGSTLIYHEFRKTSLSRVGFTMMWLAGFGTVLVGLFPENEVRALHGLGALLAFLLGDAALIIFGLGLSMSRKMRAYSILSGVVGLSALTLYFTKHYLGLGLGAMERIAGYPQTLWLITFGVYMSRNHFKHVRRAKQ